MFVGEDFLVADAHFTITFVQPIAQEKLKMFRTTLVSHVHRERAI